ncbi:MAG: Tripartite tricarboxylate transporter TctA family protein [Syntrophorhabdaceae bacterium PtaU1.Bin034]|nr:MAG: Tripartite tricarboxylate transporter TctA family protein [Syntrophorhabdaceae bacterium PtaU1.Bin034]
MDIISGLLGGFQTILQPANFLYCFIGVFIGTLIGVLPGIGPIGAMSILLPTTFGLSPAASIIMLAGIYYGSMYGGSTTSILVNIPGEAASVITCLDGYEMAKQGRAGPALGISAFGSFIGGTFSVMCLMFLVAPLAEVALKFGPAEFTALMCLSMTVLTYLASRSMLRALLMVVAGLLVGTIGNDPITAIPRFTFGSAYLLDGIGLVSVAMGLFGISEVLLNIENPEKRIMLKTKIKNILPNREDWKRSYGPIGRGSILGFVLGILPGGGGIIASFLSYTMEKKLSKHPEGFGKGSIEGVAGPETANNSASGGGFVPLLALGIPPNAIMGLLLGALIIHGISPGPLLVAEHPEIFWGVIASMYIGNVMLVLLNLPLISLWVRVLKVPYRILMPVILLCCLIGAYASNNMALDIVAMLIFGILGYALRKLDYEPAPFLLAMVLGPILETNFRNALKMSDGSLLIFVQKPISAVILGICVLLFLSTGLSSYRKTKTRIIEGGENNT